MCEEQSLRCLKVGYKRKRSCTCCYYGMVTYRLEGDDYSVWVLNMKGCVDS